MSRESQTKATVKYIKANYDRIEIKFRKEENMPQKIKEHCVKHNYLDEKGKPNKSTLFREALENQMKIDNGEYELVKKRG